jgi:acyl-CoA hydrolase
LNPIEVGELVTLKSRVNYVGNSSMVVGIRVESQNIRTGLVKHCNSSYFTMIAKDETGKTVKVPGLILKDTNDLRHYLRSIEHIKMRNERKEVYSKKNFIPDNYEEILKEYNVKLEMKD